MKPSNLLILSMMMSLTACGADEQAAMQAAIVEPETESTESAAAESVQLFSDMPECNKSREGQLVMVEAEGVLYVCKKKEWSKAPLSKEAVDIEAVKGDKGDKGDRGDKGQDGANGQDGQKGADGINGVSGQNGADGINGTNGVNGTNGADGEDADALFQEVSGATLTSIAAADAGRKISLHFTGITTITHSANLSLAGQGNFTTSEGDLIEFVSLGGGKWKELSRSVSNDSYVRARMYQMTFPLNTGWTKMPYNYEIKDSQGEYNSSTGDFTAKQKGIYTVTGSLTTAIHDWSAGGTCGVAIYVNGVLSTLKTQVMPQATIGCTSETAKTIELNPGDVVNIWVYLSRSIYETNIDWSAEYNSITISRVR